MWRTAQADVASVIPPLAFQAAHRALETAILLGLEAASDRQAGSDESPRTSAAMTGARLSLRLARELVTFDAFSVKAPRPSATDKTTSGLTR